MSQATLSAAARARTARPADRTRGSAARISSRGLITLFLLVFVAFFLVPILWLLLAATKSPSNLVSGHAFSIGSWHDLRTNWNHLMRFQDGAVKTWMKNSVIYAVGSLIITLLVSVPAGYAMAKMDFHGRRLLLITTLVVMLMPSAALVLPTFLELNYAHLINTPLSVILPFSFFPFGVYLTYIYFSTAVSADLLAAAKLDGCGDFKAFFYVGLPLATPIIALVAFFSFVGNWNNFFLPYVMLPGSGQYPMQVGLTQMLASTPTFNPVVGADAEVQPPELILATLLSVAPVLIIFLFSQRFLVSGLTAGGTKE
ncbi:carbohydrate ABC transporter permease [Jatrophihabitans telluris]|uniref:Carbohydrate ABC transporter permease n=1 Tax=Jatrophihabitans telluris TaxID=2038343 RepID=A0ABY4R1G1_9ACTN|nr:carbohydrate ABC transporter permease [Jatrophihabitans telluris]UQX89756.1 carbohydrate ABC transporter permease [Jatrophihabitans telluris]